MPLSHPPRFECSVDGECAPPYPRAHVGPFPSLWESLLGSAFYHGPKKIMKKMDSHFGPHLIEILHYDCGPVSS